MAYSFIATRDSAHLWNNRVNSSPTKKKRRSPPLHPLYFFVKLSSPFRIARCKLVYLQLWECYNKEMCLTLFNSTLILSIQLLRFWYGSTYILNICSWCLVLCYSSLILLHRKCCPLRCSAISECSISVTNGLWTESNYQVHYPFCISMYLFISCQ